MTYLQSSTKNVLSPSLLIVVATLFVGTYASTAQAAPLFEEPVNYEISKFDDLGEEDWGGQVLDSVVADFNNDGHLDIAGTYQDGGTPSADYNTPAGIEGVVILINDGDGTFTITDYIPYGDTPTVIVSADLDNDGDEDLATNSNDSITVLLNDGAGSFSVSPQLVIASDPRNLVVADFDGDSYMDLSVTVDEISPENGIQNEPGIQVFMNDGMGEFTLDSSILTSTPGYTGIADLTVADFDDDGDVDIFAGSANGIAIYSVIINDGNGVFDTSEVTLYTEEAGNAPTFNRLASADIDGDSDIDVIATIDGSQEMSMLTLVNDGTASFVVGETIPFGPNSDAIVVSDIDADGDVDTVVPRYDIYGNWIHVSLNDGLGAFTPVEDTINIPYLSVTSLDLADLNNDSKSDLIISTPELGIVIILQTASENQTPVEQAATLLAGVMALDLPNNLENSYLANLFKVEGFIQNSQITPAINQLNAFIGKVNQDYNQNKITQQVRDDLVTSAQELIDDLTS